MTSASFALSCETTGAHSFALSGAGATYTLDPDADLGVGESCSLTVDDQGVTDVDTNDPPDTMTADRVVRFTTLGVAARIYEIQGATHVSPLAGKVVSGVPGVVTSVRPNSFTMQDATGDGISATSDAILVFANGIGGSVSVGQAVTVSGRVTEFRPGGSTSANLTTTEITAPAVTPGGPGAAIAQTVIGAGGRVPPTSVIDDDANGDVESSGSYDPATDGIDFWESLEAMLLRVPDPVVVGPTNSFGEVWVLANDGAGAGIRTARQGIVVGAGGLQPGADSARGRHRCRRDAGGERRRSLHGGGGGSPRLQLRQLRAAAHRRPDPRRRRPRARGDEAAALDRARRRQLQRREPVAGRSAGEVRAAGRADRRQPPLAGHRGRAGDPGQRRAGELGRHGCDADLPAARRGDPGRGRAGVRVPSDRPGGRRGRRPARGQHPRRAPVPHRRRARLRRPAGRRPRRRRTP